MALLERGLLRIPFRLESELSAVMRLLTSYEDVPVSLADGCLVRMAEQIRNGVVCTLDSDVKIYRKNRKQVIPTLVPDDV